MSDRSLMQRLLDAGVSMDYMEHHYSDLYVFVTPVSTRVIEEWCKEKGYDRLWHCPIFREQKTGAPMYDCHFAYDPYWEDKAAKAEMLFGKEGRQWRM